MLHIHHPADLKKLGINPLTGEADPLCMRVLCDVSESGRALLLDYFGLPADTPLHPNWNSMVGDDPAIGCFMLSRELLGDRNFWVYALLFSGFDQAIVHEHQGQVTGLHMSDYEKYPTIADACVGRLHSRPSAFRNTHQFTGRTA